MAVYSVGPGGLYGIFHSTNFGDGNWTADDPGTCALHPDAFRSGLAASPINSGRLLAVGADDQPGNNRPCLGTADAHGATTWSTLGPGGDSLHMDYRAVAFRSDGTAFIGGDGGIFTSADGGVNWSTLASQRLPAPTLVSFDVSPSSPRYLYMATWDTGLWATTGGPSWVSTQQDTTDIEVDPTNALRAWAAVGGNGVDRFVTVDGGIHFDAFNGDLATSPFGSVMRTNGGSSLLTTHFRAVYSTTVPATLRPSTGVLAPHWSRFPASGTPDFSGIVAGLAVNRPGHGVILAMYAWINRNPDGSLPNKLYVFDPRTFSWRSSGSQFAGAVGRIATTPNGSLAYAITEDNNLWNSSDYGTNWTLVPGNAPSGLTDVLIDPTNPSRVFVGTVHGVYVSTPPGAWSAWNQGLPFRDGTGASISQLRTIVSGGTTYLYAGVVGRGIFRRTITSGPMLDFPLPPLIYRPDPRIMYDPTTGVRLEPDIVVDPELCLACTYVFVREGEIQSLAFDPKRGIVIGASKPRSLAMSSPKKDPLLAVVFAEKGGRFEGCDACAGLAAKGTAVRGLVIENGKLRAVVAAADAAGKGVGAKTSK